MVFPRNNSSGFERFIADPINKVRKWQREKYPEELFFENTLNAITDKKLLADFLYKPHVALHQAYSRDPKAYNNVKRQQREDMKPIQEREEGLSGPQKFNRRLKNYVTGESRPAFGSAIVEKDWDEADKDYITPLIPEEASESFNKFMKALPTEYGDKALPFIFDAFREVTSPADLDFTIAMMFTFGQVNPIQAQALKAAITAQKGVPASRVLFNPARGAYTQYFKSAKAPLITSPKARKFTSSIAKPAKVVGHMLKPIGYNTPGLKGFLIRGGSEFALGTSFVSGMRLMDSGIQKFAPDFYEDHPNISAAISMLGGGFGGVISGNLMWNVGKNGTILTSKAIKGTAQTLKDPAARTQILLGPIIPSMGMNTTGGPIGKGSNAFEGVERQIDAHDVLFKNLASRTRNMVDEASSLDEWEGAGNELHQILDLIVDYTTPEKITKHTDGWSMERIREELNTSPFENMRDEIENMSEYKNLNEKYKTRIDNLLNEHTNQAKIIDNQFYEVYDDAQVWSETFGDINASTDKMFGKKNLLQLSKELFGSKRPPERFEEGELSYKMAARFTDKTVDEIKALRQDPQKAKSAGVVFVKGAPRVKIDFGDIDTWEGLDIQTVIKESDFDSFEDVITAVNKLGDDINKAGGPKAYQTRQYTRNAEAAKRTEQNNINWVALGKAIEQNSDFGKNINPNVVENVKIDINQEWAEKEVNAVEVYQKMLPKLELGDDYGGMSLRKVFENTIQEKINRKLKNGEITELDIKSGKAVEDNSIQMSLVNPDKFPNFLETPDNPEIYASPNIWSELPPRFTNLKPEDFNVIKNETLRLNLNLGDSDIRVKAAKTAYNKLLVTQNISKDDPFFQIKKFYENIFEYLDKQISKSDVTQHNPTDKFLSVEIDLGRISHWANDFKYGFNQQFSKVRDLEVNENFELIRPIAANRMGSTDAGDINFQDSMLPADLTQKTRFLQGTKSEPAIVKKAKDSGVSPFTIDEVYRNWHADDRLKPFNAPRDNSIDASKMLDPFKLKIKQFYSIGDFTGDLKFSDPYYGTGPSTNIKFLNGARLDNYTDAPNNLNVFDSTREKLNLRKVEQWFKAKDMVKKHYNAYTPPAFNARGFRPEINKLELKKFHINQKIHMWVLENADKNFPTKYARKTVDDVDKLWVSSSTRQNSFYGYRLWHDLAELLLLGYKKIDPNVKAKSYAIRNVNKVNDFGELKVNDITGEKLDTATKPYRNLNFPFKSKGKTFSQPFNASIPFRASMFDELWTPNLNNKYKLEEIQRNLSNKTEYIGVQHNNSYLPKGWTDSQGVIFNPNLELENAINKYNSESAMSYRSFSKESDGWEDFDKLMESNKEIYDTFIIKKIKPSDVNDKLQVRPKYLFSKDNEKPLFEALIDEPGLSTSDGKHVLPDSSAVSLLANMLSAHYLDNSEVIRQIKNKSGTPIAQSKIRGSFESSSAPNYINPDVRVWSGTNYERLPIGSPMSLEELKNVEILNESLLKEQNKAERYVNIERSLAFSKQLRNAQLDERFKVLKADEKFCKNDECATTAFLVFDLGYVPRDPNKRGTPIYNLMNKKLFPEAYLTSGFVNTIEENGDVSRTWSSWIEARRGDVEGQYANYVFDTNTPIDMTGRSDAFNLKFKTFDKWANSKVGNQDLNPSIAQRIELTTENQDKLRTLALNSNKLGPFTDLELDSVGINWEPSKDTPLTGSGYAPIDIDESLFKTDTITGNLKPSGFRSNRVVINDINIESNKADPKEIDDLNKNMSGDGDSWAARLGIKEISEGTAKGKYDMAVNFREEMGEEIGNILVDANRLDGTKSQGLTAWQVSELEKLLKNKLKTTLLRKTIGDLAVGRQYRKLVKDLIANSTNVKENSPNIVENVIENLHVTQNIIEVSSPNLKGYRKLKVDIFDSEQVAIAEERGFEPSIEALTPESGGGANGSGNNIINTDFDWEGIDPEDILSGPKTYQALLNSGTLDGQPKNLSDLKREALGRTFSILEELGYNSAKYPINKDELDWVMETDLFKYYDILVKSQRDKTLPKWIRENSISKHTIRRFKAFFNPNVYALEDEIQQLRAAREIIIGIEKGRVRHFMNRWAAPAQREFGFIVKNAGIRYQDFKSAWYLAKKSLNIPFWKHEHLDGVAQKVKVSANLDLPNKKYPRSALEKSHMTEEEIQNIRLNWLIENEAHGHTHLLTLPDIINSVEPTSLSKGRYDLTKNQKVLLNIVQKVQDYNFRQSQEFLVKARVDDARTRELIGDEYRGYFHRQILEYPSEKGNFTKSQIDKANKNKSRMWGDLGKLPKQLEEFINRRSYNVTRKSYTRQRIYDDMDELIKLGYKINMNPFEVIESRLYQGIEFITDRLIEIEMEKLGIKSANKAFRSSQIGKDAIANTKNALENKNKVGKEWLAAKKRLETKGATDAQHARANTAFNILTNQKDGAQVEYQKALRQETAAKKKFDPERRRSLGVQRVYYKNKVVPAEIQNSVDTYFKDLSGIGPTGNKGVYITEQALKMQRALLTTGEFSFTGIQLLALGYSNPDVFVKSLAGAFVSMADNPFAYYQRNAEIMDLGIKVGAITPPEEFMFSEGLSALPTKAPLVGGALDHTNRMFSYSIMIAQTELFKAMTSAKKMSRFQVQARNVGSFLPFIRPASLLQKYGITDPSILRGELLEGNIPKNSRLYQDVSEGDAPANFIDVGKLQDELVDLAKYVRNVTGTENYEIIGVRGNQKMIEQFGAFAARFLRSTLGTFHAAGFDYGIRGQMARRTISSLFIGGIALTIGSHWLFNRKMPNLDNPEASDYLQVRYPDGTYDNHFGLYYPYLRAGARSSQHIAKGEFKEAAKEWYYLFQSKAGLIIRDFDMFAHLQTNGEYRTFDGEIIDWSGAGALVLIGESGPIAYQQIVEGIFGEDQPRPFVFLEMFGKNIRLPNTPNFVRQELSRQLYNKDWEELADEGRYVERAKVDNHPKVLGIQLEASRRSGGYRGALANIDADEYMTKLTLLNRLLFDDKGTYSHPTQDELNRFRAGWLQDANGFRERRQQAKEDFGQEWEEDRKDATNKYQQAMYDYFDILDASNVVNRVTGQPTFDGKLFNQRFENYKEKVWDKEQSAYVEEYRNRHLNPQGFDYLRNFDNRRGGTEYYKALKLARNAAKLKETKKGDLSWALITYYNKYRKIDNQDEINLKHDQLMPNDRIKKPSPNYFQLTGTKDPFR